MNPTEHHGQCEPGQKGTHSPNNNVLIMNTTDSIESGYYDPAQHELFNSSSTTPNDRARPSDSPPPHINTESLPTPNTKHHSPNFSVSKGALQTLDSTPPVHARDNTQPTDKMAQAIAPAQAVECYLGGQIIVSGEPVLRPASSAREWLCMGRCIYDVQGAPLKILDWNTDSPVILAHVRDDELGSIPRFNQRFNIGNWKNVYQPQIREIDYWINRFTNARLHAWRGNNHQHETHSRIAIENAPPQTLTVAERACLNYIQQVDELEGEQIRPPRVRSQFPPSNLPPGIATSSRSFQPPNHLGALSNFPLSELYGHRHLRSMETAEQAYGSGIYRSTNLVAKAPKLGEVPQLDFSSQHAQLSDGGRQPSGARILRSHTGRSSNQSGADTESPASPPFSRNTRTRFLVPPQDMSTEPPHAAPSSTSRNYPGADDPILRTLLETTETRRRQDDTKSADPVRRQKRRGKSTEVAEEDVPRLVDLVESLGLECAEGGEDEEDWW